MNDGEKLCIGMPAGSLADPNRGGNLIHLLEQAGFKTKGYTGGGPSSFSTVGCFYGWDGRPQEFGAQLSIREIDVAIAGDDWIRERLLELEHEYNTKLDLEKVLSLKRGGVRIVGIIRNDSAASETVSLLKQICARKKIITVVAEMPFLALEWIRTKLKEAGLLEDFSAYSVQKYKTPPKIEQGIVLYETWGKTEAKVKNGGADLGVEITQSGSAIRNYGLRITDTIMESETGIWINPEIKNNPEKNELLTMFLINLYGVINAENKTMILFNAANEHLEEIEDYLKEKNLYADEPTRNRGDAYTEYSIQVETNNPDLPIARVRYELAKRGARSIDTVPFTSSIPGIDAV
jgi:ATP phosphoribosyltransferase